MRDRSPETDAERAERYAAIEAQRPSIDPSDLRAQSRRSFLGGGAAALAGVVGWRWLQGRPADNGIPDVLRAGHEANESLWRAISREQALAPTFDRSESSILRVNGRRGLDDEIDLDTWSLQVLAPDGKTLGRHTLDEITVLPKVEMTVEHKCVEGWSHIVTWGGTPFANFAELYREDLGGELPKFVSLHTPDRRYYVGLDIESMRNPQMLLAWELEGEALSQEHGAPLRLATPNKYGTKCIKRIGTIQFSHEQPTDFWFERGYDWYAQL